MDFKRLMRPGSLAEITAHHLGRLAEVSPEVTVFMGLIGEAPGLPPMGPEGIAAKLDVHRRWLADLRALDPATLTPEERLDVRVYETQGELVRYLLEDLARWRHNPDAVSPLGELFFILLTAETASEERRFVDVRSRLRAVPDYLEGVRRQLTVLDRGWADLAIRVSDGMVGLWSSVSSAAEAAVPGSLAAEVRAEAARAARAVEEYRAWIVAHPRRAEGMWVLDDERFEGLLRRKVLGVDIAELRRMGRDDLERLRALRADLARRLTGASDLAAARTAANRRTPASFEEAVRQVRSFVGESRRFLAEADVVPLLDHEGMTVVRTPEFFEPLIPFAAMLEAGMYAPIQRSVYLVTPPADGDLSVLSADRFSGIAVHEGYPGHHLQHTFAHRHTSIYRNNPYCGFPMDGAGRFGLDFVEGWAHYCEEMMKDQGFHDTVESRFLLAEDQLFRAVRIIIDVDLSTGRMTMDEAQAMLREEVGMAPAAARAEVRRYTTSPTYQLCYLLGKHKIERLRAEIERLDGPRFDLGAFHHELLSGGCIPVDVMRDHMLARRTGAA